MATRQTKRPGNVEYLTLLRTLVMEGLWDDCDACHYIRSIIEHEGGTVPPSQLLEAPHAD